MFGHRRALGQRLVGRQLGLGGGQVGARLRQGRLGGLERGLGVQDFLAADAARLGQRLAPLQVALGALQVGLGARDLGLPHVDVGGQGVVLDVERADLAHRLGQARLGLLQRHVGVGRIQPHQRLARRHGLGVVGLDGDDGAGHLRRDLHQVAVDIGVVGALEVRAEQRPPDGIGDGQHGEHTGCQPQQAFAGGVGGRGGAHEV
ncbi:Uncharacterised protein [Bordetella pertussis]|nr:Uncharacterised protein [Bordetella pertussis]